MQLSDHDFVYLRKFVHDNSAMVTAEDAKSSIELKLRVFIRAENFDSFDALIAKVRGEPHGNIARGLVDHLTNNETLFFRDPLFFDALKDDLIPALMSARARTRAISIWSAASSSGQEIYSLVMTLIAHFPQLNRWNVKIIASDISDTMLDRCREGLYSDLEVRRGLPPEFKERFFDAEGRKWRIKAHVRRMVEFRQLNLSRPWPHLPQIDLLLLRNVLIYFDHPTKQAILRRARQVMAADGHLALGGGETALTLDDNLERVRFGGANVFRLCSAAAKRAA